MRPAFADYPRHLEILRAAALAASDPAAAVRGHLSAADLAEAERVFIVGAGKAGVAMARAAAEIAGARLAGGIMAVPQVPAASIPGLTFIQGGHPLPSAGSLAAGRALAELLAQTTPRDRVLALISGGGSALLEHLQPGLTLADLQSFTQVLLKCGATIHEFNTVRQRLSRIKGGGLARLAAPAPVLALILSDVVGNDLRIIASGPTVTEPAEPDAAVNILRRYHLETQVPPAVWAAVTAAEAAAAPTAQVEHRLIASNRQAGEAAAAAARALGFEVEYLGDDWQGEARAAGAEFARRVLAAIAPRALIAGGETTVTVRGQGRGGRNQEAALSAALTLAGRPGRVVAALATDGVDGPTDAAGAVVTGDTLRRAQALGLDLAAYLADNNAYAGLAALDALWLSGPTGTNVNDLWFGLAY